MAFLRDKSPLGDVSIETFLSQYWQRQPLLIRQAIDPKLLSIEADLLAGLALEEQVESRLITEQDGKWSLSHGPFTEENFEQLPASHWTLLIQAVDHYLPEVHQLLDLFRFVPHWRLDDIMISYAVEGGSVGPHFDQYDVFLLQGCGQRRWQVGDQCDSETQLQAQSDLTLIDDFQPQQEYILSPGDLLYLPPGVGHYGVALGECVTYSVGFRSPSAAEAYSSLTDFLTDAPDAQSRYRDGGQRACDAEISQRELDQFIAWMKAQLDNKTMLQQWFGREMTRSKYIDLEPGTGTFDGDSKLTINDIVAGDPHAIIMKPLDSRWAYINSDTTDDELAQLFVSGLSFLTNLALAKALCNHNQWAAADLASLALDERDQATLDNLLSQELLFIELD